MYKVYFAGDLFDHKHIAGNHLLAQRIEKLSNGLYKCMLPQDWEGKNFSNSIDIRNEDIKEIIQADICLFNFDGTDIDSGTAAEFVISKMLDIPAIVLRTDYRNGGYLFDEDWNLMVSGYPRSAIVQYSSLALYNSLGLEGAHLKIAQSIISSFEKVTQEKSLLDSHEEIFSVYRHVIKMCGSGLEIVIPKQLLQEIVATKIENNIYPPAKAAQVIDSLQN